ncbi:hypothetical protein PISMIDRAFT_99959, partial [Pisolithus microcarpus 441]
MELEEELFTIDNEEASSSNAAVECTCITHVTDKSISLCASWKAVIWTIIDPFIKYMSAMLGKPLPILQFPLSSCFLSINILSCDCSSLPQTLISHGLFPTTVSRRPWMAVSVELLSFYCALFECSCDAINVLAAALNTYYSRRGFCMTNPKGTTVKDPFHCGLSQAMQWYAILQVEVEKQV